jgi:prepilin-type N-terminal cleavage/methylation domain-containing protein
MDLQRRGDEERKTSRQAGFTLLEVLVVAICVAILTALVVLYHTK